MSPIIRVLLHLVFPSACPLCSSDLPSDSASPICTSCEIAFPSNPLCEAGGNLSLRRVYSGAEFEGAVRKILHQFKYSGREDLALWLGAWLVSTVGLEKGIFDCIVPVPASRWTEWKRGYNQSDSLATVVAARLECPVERGWIKSRIFYPSQTRLGKRERNKNAARRFSAAHRRRLSCRHVLLVDDVRTTGATLRRCAQVLRRAGASQVSALVVARD